ncbi:MAG: hypothetical protein IJM99_11290, partial [Firmicutes bacterium]|nr:hypothetical protein [Bacillota bacterium]
PKPDDTADALAAAICHGHAAPGKERMKKYEEALSQKNAQQIKKAQSTKNRWEQLIEDYEKGVKR